ncbi:MAG: MSCRAMM family adhesin SdrC, partial [Thermoplasmata archaeon]|nr:MSCRAMM family adhesin SdrC [Thermoplasmata archaeon]
TIGEYELYNYAYVDALDPQGHEAYDRDYVYVDVVHPSIEITKFSELTCAHDDETIEYVITVTNTGDTWLNGTIYDDLLGLSVPFADLRSGETIYLYPDYTVPVGSEWIVNEAWVEAFDHQDHRVTDYASWTVEILHPEIDVEKTGPVYANAGDIITYTVVVTNIGDTELFEVGLFDSLVGPIAYYPMLAIGETQTITYTYTVPSGEGIVYNEVEAWGIDRQDRGAYDWDSWEVMKYSKLVASKFADLDQDGVWSEHEPGVESWVIDLVGQLDDGTWDNRTRLTDSSGYFEFTNLQAGVYTVSEAMVTGWQSMTTTTYTLTVGSGTLHFCTFGNVPLGTISGSKWWDHDLDGFWDEGEEGIEGWNIYLMGDDANGDYITLSTVTDANGDYTFSNLLPGLYTVYEEDRDGWYPTTPSSVVVDTSLTLDTFTVIDVDFGNAKYGSITGYKWLDEYMNGYWDGDELRLEGWTIWLEGDQVDGMHIGPISTTTDENGNYAFLDLLPGVYTVWEELPDGWYAVTPASREITLIEGSEVTCAKVGNIEYGSISGWKFLDWDMDGMMDGDEPGIPGWAITITGWQNDGDLPWTMMGWEATATYIEMTVYTDANGYWEFPDLLPGVYTVTEASDSM